MSGLHLTLQMDSLSVQKYMYVLVRSWTFLMRHGFSLDAEVLVICIPWSYEFSGRKQKAHKNVFNRTSPGALHPNVALSSEMFSTTRQSTGSSYKEVIVPNKLQVAPSSVIHKRTEIHVWKWMSCCVKPAAYAERERPVTAVSVAHKVSAETQEDSSPPTRQEDDRRSQRQAAGDRYDNFGKKK